MDLQRQDLKKLLSKINVDADSVSLRRVYETVTHRGARNGRMDHLSRNCEHGVMVDVMVEGQIAYGATDDFSVEAIQAVAQKAAQNARKASEYSLFSFNEKQRPVAQGEFRSSFEKSVDSLSEAEIFDTLIGLSEDLKVDEKIKEAGASSMEIHRVVDFFSTGGSDFEQEFLMHNLVLRATASNGQNHQLRSTSNGTAQIGLEVYDRPQWQKEAVRVGEEALELLGAEECPSEVCDLLLHPDQLYLQVHESIGHPLELDRILGDERNYAGWSFVRPEDFGHMQYGSSLLNVTFDPTVSGELASYLFDDVGHRATKEYLIKEGKLLRGLGGLESQARSGLLGVANSRTCSWNRPPMDRMANINIEPGASSMDEMISSIERGVYMQTNKSWSIDDYRNKFQFGCEYAQWIEDGRIVKTLKNPNYRGVTPPFWNSLKKVGDGGTFEIHGSPYCGKGEPNQVIRVGHATPACLFQGIEVFGGAK